MFIFIVWGQLFSWWFISCLYGFRLFG